MSDLDDQIAAYNAMREELETDHTGEWVLFHDGKLESLHDCFESAADEAVEKFGRGPFLIRQVGAPPIVLPPSIMHEPTRFS